MTTDEKPGLKVRRRRDEEAAAPESPSADAEATNDATPTAAPAAAATPETSDAPATSAPPATAPTAAASPDPTPAPTPAPVSGSASAGESRRSKAWRADVVLPGMTSDEPEQRPVARREGPPPTTDDFAAMLGDAPVSLPTFDMGDKITAPIVAIGADAIFVSLGGKAEGALDRGEFTSPEGELTVSVGDEVTAYVVSTRDGIKLSKSLGRGNDAREALSDAAAQGIPVEGKVTGTNKGGYEVEVLGARAFCPHSQIDLDPTTQPEVHIGATYTFLVVRVEEEGRNVVVSRRALIERDREEAAEQTLEALAIGATFDGKVSRVTDFGAFVDIGGIDGLVHVSELSWARVDHPSELVRVGDRVRVSVLSTTDLDDPRSRRIALSMKSLEEDPWVAGVRDLSVGDSMTGTVARLETFGAFVELAPGLDGLVHVSEISAGRRINHPRDVLSPGDSVQVQILRIDPSRRQIALSIKSLMDDPWSVAARDLPVGSTIQGTVDSVQPFGVFVELPGGINGLLPLSQLPDDEARHVHNRFRPGHPVEARVLGVDASRQRLTLTRREDAEADERDAFASYKAETRGTASLGTFADLLKGRS